MSHEPTDTRVTAYVFGELSPKATAAFEREMARSTTLREEVAALRETVAALENEFASQSDALTEVHLQTIQTAMTSKQHSSGDEATDASVSLPSSGPVTAPRRESTSRRLLLFASLAASVLLLFALAYPKLREDDHAIVAGSNLPSQSTAKFSKEDAATPQDELITYETLLAQETQGVSSVPSPEVDATLFSDPIELSQLTVIPPPSSISKQPPTSLSYRFGDADLLMGGAMAGGGAGVANASGGEPQPQVWRTQRRSRRRAVVPSKPRALQDSGVDAKAMTPASDNSARGMKMSDEDMSLDAAFMEFDLNELEANDLEMLPAESRMAMDADAMMDRDLDAEADAMVEMMEEMMGGMDMEDGMMGMEMDEMGMMEMMEMEMGMEMAMGDQFQPIEDNPFLAVSQSPLSTFSIDVDTASYAKVRSLLNRGVFPSPDAVRIEELLNYFDYDYPPPTDEHPFASSMEIESCPWNPQHRLARIGIKGKVIERQRPSSNLVFLLDVSGSMDESNKLPLVIEGMKMLTDQLTENDKVAIVVYAGAAGMVLDATRGDKKSTIVGALDNLKAGGSTNGGEGILLAYQIAHDNFVQGGTNRVILCSDGDFNVGVTGTDHLVKIAQQNAKSDIFLSVLGFGVGNHNDAMMEEVSNKGNGNYSFIDSKSEARKVLVDEMGSTLVTIAKDVKIQVEFNPREVAEYRLIGYENRALDDEDFDNDQKDGGEIGAGHTVTALYEIVPATDAPAQPADDGLRYQQRPQLNQRAESGEMLNLKLRYKQPSGDVSTLVEFAVKDEGKDFQQTDRDFKFAASVASFGMLLRDSPHRGNASFESVLKMARQGATGDDFGYRTEFVKLVEDAQARR